MKKTLLKSVVAAAVATTAVSLCGVSAWAIPTTNPTTALELVTYEFDKSKEGYLKTHFTWDNLNNGTTNTSTDGRFVVDCKADSGGLIFKKESAGQYGAKFKTPAEPVTITFTATSADLNLSYDSVSNDSVVVALANGTKSVDIPANTVCTLSTEKNSGLKVSAMKVETQSTDPSLTVSPETLTIEQGSTGTITANLRNATGITWTSSDKTGKVTVSGDDTGATVTVADDAAAGDVNITATAGSLTKTVTVTVKAAGAFTKAKASTGKVDFTQDMTNPDPTASDGQAKYTEGAVIKDYFKASGPSLVYREAPCVQTGSTGSGNLYFELSEAANVTVTYNTTGNKNVSDIAIKDSKTGNNVSAIVLGFGSESYSKAIGGVNGKTTFTAYNLPAGSYEIYSPCVTKVVKDNKVEIVNGASGDKINRGARIYDVTFSAATTKKVAETKAEFQGDYYCVDKDVTYLIHPITGDVSAKTSITGPDGKVSNEVYKAVEFTDGSSISASDLGCDYIYAVAITDAGRAPVKALTWTLE